MQDTAELVRPYAIAAFQQAEQEGKLGEWADMLGLLETIVNDPTAKGLVSNPKVANDQLVGLILDVAGDRFSSSVGNLVKLLAENGRLGLVPELVRSFNEERARSEGRSDVSVLTAYELDDEQKRTISEAMSKRLGADVNLSVEIDSSLIGGVVIRAGDLVIDASLRGRLKQLAQSLG